MQSNTKKDLKNNTDTLTIPAAQRKTHRQDSAAFFDNRPDALQLKKLQDNLDEDQSPTSKLASISKPVRNDLSTAHQTNRQPIPVQRMVSEEGDLLQGKFDAVQRQRVLGANVVQRLEVERTQWGSVQSITSSTAGAGGVLFMSDGSNKRVVVKPGVPADEEMAAAHGHATISPGRLATGWKVRGLSSRMATANDVAGIRVAKQRVFANQAPNARTAGLLDDVAAGETLIQQAASGATSFKDKMMAQAPTGHLVQGEDRPLSSNDKVHKNSPIKPLMKNNSGFARSLGRLAAVDILLGNFDRLADAANLENLLLKTGSKTIYPIDNTGGTAVARLTMGGGPVVGGVFVNPHWSGHRLGKFFIAGDYAAIAEEAWSENDTAMLTILDDILTGFEGAPPARQYNVRADERAEVKAKLVRHIADIKAAYAQGLREGRDNLVAAGPPAGISNAAQQQYAARIAEI